MGTPSFKTIANAFPSLSPLDVKRVRNAMLDQNPRKAMVTIDEILSTHGVEYIPQGHNVKSPAITYCNTGDPYKITVLYMNGRYSVGCWGNIVERGNYD